MARVNDQHWKVAIDVQSVLNQVVVHGWRATPLDVIRTQMGPKHANVNDTTDRKETGTSKTKKRCP